VDYGALLADTIKGAGIAPGPAQQPLSKLHRIFKPGWAVVSPDILFQEVPPGSLLASQSCAAQLHRHEALCCQGSIIGLGELQLVDIEEGIGILDRLDYGRSLLYSRNLHTGQKAQATGLLQALS